MLRKDNSFPLTSESRITILLISAIQIICHIGSLSLPTCVNRIIIQYDMWWIDHTSLYHTHRSWFLSTYVNKTIILCDKYWTDHTKLHHAHRIMAAYLLSIFLVMYPKHINQNCIRCTRTYQSDTTLFLLILFPSACPNLITSSRVMNKLLPSCYVHEWWSASLRAEQVVRIEHNER